MTTMKIMLVDDHDMVRRGLSAYLDTEPGYDIVAEASSGKEAVQKAKALIPDVILMDLVMENGTGIQATEEIMKLELPCKIIILTSFYDDDMIFPAIEAGATSYILKTSSAKDILEAIDRAYRGESTIDPKVTQKMMSQLRKPKALHENLTNRELEVLKLIGNGKSNQEIADHLFIGIKTVKTHVSHILEKLQVSDRTQAAIYANQHDLI